MERINQEINILPDGSLDYGDGVIGPSIHDQVSSNTLGDVEPSPTIKSAVNVLKPQENHNTVSEKTSRSLIPQGIRSHLLAARLLIAATIGLGGTGCTSNPFQNEQLPDAQVKQLCESKIKSQKPIKKFSYDTTKSPDSSYTVEVISQGLYIHEGNETRQLTSPDKVESGARDGGVRISPDGNKIAFIRNTLLDEEDRLYSISKDGGGLLNLTKHKIDKNGKQKPWVGRIKNFAFSADGKDIVVIASEKSSNFDSIYVISGVSIPRKIAELGVGEDANYISWTQNGKYVTVRTRMTDLTRPDPAMALTIERGRKIDITNLCE